MISIRYNDSIIELIKIFSDNTEKIKEVSSTITAVSSSSTSNGSGFLYRHQQQNYILTATHVIVDNNNNLAQNVYATYYKKW